MMKQLKTSFLTPAISTINARLCRVKSNIERRWTSTIASYSKTCAWRTLAKSFLSTSQTLRKRQKEKHKPKRTLTSRVQVSWFKSLPMVAISCLLRLTCFCNISTKRNWRLTKDSSTLKEMESSSTIPDSSLMLKVSRSLMDTMRRSQRKMAETLLLWKPN